MTIFRRNNMKKKIFCLFCLVPLLLIGCSKKEAPKSSGEQSSAEQPSSSESIIPDAPVDQIALTLNNFSYSDVLPEPQISGLTAENVQVAYGYFLKNGEKEGTYVPGSPAGSIRVGEYVLKAEVTSSTYKPFELSTEFAVSKAEEMPGLEFVAYDYKYDENKPEPDVFNVPAGTEISYKWYHLSSDKHVYVPGSENDIAPGSYTLEATFENPNYVTKVKTYGFVVLKANFDSKYALSTNSIDVGKTDIGFHINDFDLNPVLSMNIAATGLELEGVTFTWKEEYTLYPGIPLEAKIIAHKEHFNDKEFDLTVTGEKTAVEIPTLPQTSFTYDGNPHSVIIKNLDETRVKIDPSSILEATDAATRTVKFVLKDQINNCWSDGTSSDKAITWEITKYNPAGVSTGFRIKVGDYLGKVNDVQPSIDKTVLANPLTLGVQFRNNNYSYQDYSQIEFTVMATSESTAHITDGQLIVDDLTKNRIDLLAETTNPNHQFSQFFTIFISDVSEDPTRILAFTGNDLTASYSGLDQTNIVDANPAESQGDYIVKLYTNGNGFKVDRTFAKVNNVKLKFHFSDECTYAAFQIFFSETDSYSDNPNQFNRQLNKEKAAHDDSTMYDIYVGDMPFEDGKEYYLHIWFNGNPTNSAVFVDELQIWYPHSV